MLKVLEIGLNPYLTYLMLLRGLDHRTGHWSTDRAPVSPPGLWSGGSYPAPADVLHFAHPDDVIKLIWGTAPLLVSKPSTLLGQVSVGGIPYTWYHFLLLIAVSIVFGGLLVWLVRGTRFGKIIVSVINDREVSIAVGINVNRIYTLSFTSGPLRCPLGRSHCADDCCGARVCRGSRGSRSPSSPLAAWGVWKAPPWAHCSSAWRGRWLFILLEFELVVIYLIMLLVLMIKPEGLFGEVELRRI